ncbi:hypothetical protein [Pararhizobium qamdonense]|uniref:hypothetical protein n=1 Tax=Pararhizobium qamdonense TaxID=3031126 RepID=UPI0023E2BF9F|nr:hypothetical protein [Pararhizobium qamdonense]
MSEQDQDDFAMLAELLRKIAAKHGRPYTLSDEKLSRALIEACRASQTSVTY